MNAGVLRDRSRKRMAGRGGSFGTDGLASPSSESDGAERAPLDPLILAICAALQIYVWRFQDVYSIFAALQLPSLLSLLVLGLYMMDHDRRRAIRTVRHHPVFRMALFIMILAVLSVPTSVHDGMSFRFIRDDLGKNFALMAILAASVRSIVDARRYAAAMLFGAFVYAQYIYFNISVGISGRLGDLIYYDANDLGMLLVCSIPIALFFLLRGRGILPRVAATVCLALFVIVIIKTGSRGAFLGLIAMALYLLFMFSSVSRNIRLLSVVAGVVALTTLGSEQYWGMMNTLLNPKEDYNWSGNSDSGRVEVWKRGLGYMFSRPITGVGVFAFPVAEGTLSPLADRQELGIGLKWSAAHNSFIQIGAELGVFGLIAFILAIGHAYRSARTIDDSGTPEILRGRSPPRARASDAKVLGQAVAGSVVGYVVTGFFLSQAYAAFLFVLFGLVIGMSKAMASSPSPSLTSQMPSGQPLSRRSPVPSRRRGGMPAVVRNPLSSISAS